jgi:hypothetical protein
MFTNIYTLTIIIMEKAVELAPIITRGGAAVLAGGLAGVGAERGDSGEILGNTPLAELPATRDQVADIRDYLTRTPNGNLVRQLEIAFINQGNTYTNADFQAIVQNYKSLNKGDRFRMGQVGRTIIDAASKEGLEAQRQKVIAQENAKAKAAEDALKAQEEVERLRDLQGTLNTDFVNLFNNQDGFSPRDFKNIVTRINAEMDTVRQQIEDEYKKQQTALDELKQADADILEQADRIAEQDEILKDLETHTAVQDEIKDIVLDIADDDFYDLDEFKEVDLEGEDGTRRRGLVDRFKKAIGGNGNDGYLLDKNGVPKGRVAFLQGGGLAYVVKQGQGEVKVDDPPELEPDNPPEVKVDDPPEVKVDDPPITTTAKDPIAIQNIPRVRIEIADKHPRKIPVKTESDGKQEDATTYFSFKTDDYERGNYLYAAREMSESQRSNTHINLGKDFVMHTSGETVEDYNIKNLTRKALKRSHIKINTSLPFKVFQDRVSQMKDPEI